MRGVATLLFTWPQRLKDAMKRVLLLGMGITALSALDSLAARFQVVSVIRDAHPGLDGGDDEVRRRARELGVPVIADISMAAVEQAVIDFNPDCTVVSTFDRILIPRILNRGRFVNVHYAPLPRYRGRAVVNWALLNGETEWAITIHAIAPDLDAGNVLYQKRVPIGPDDTVGSLYSAWNEILRGVLAETVERYIDGYAGEPQDELAATYGCTRVPDDGEIDWSDSTEHICALVRSLGPPYPSAYTYLETRRILVARVAPVQDAPHYAGRVPGRIVGRSRQSGHVDVLTGDGVVRIHEVRADDSTVGPASAVITSTRQTLGLRAGQLIPRIEALERQVAALAGEINLPRHDRAQPNFARVEDENSVR
jgi:methionyl-tRNA formyltransferase